MTEKELVKKIKSLKQIEPRKDWVLLTKNQILGKEERLMPVWPKLDVFLFLRPQVLVPLALFLIVGSIFYFANLERLDVSQTKVAELEQDLARLEVLTPVLEQLQANLSRAREDLEKTQIKDARTVLETKKNVDAVVENARKVAAEIRKATETESEPAETPAEDPLKEKAYTSIIADDIEKASGDLEKSYQEKIKEWVEYFIEDIEHWALGEIDQQRFEEAKEAYLNGDYNQALEKILSLGY